MFKLLLFAVVVLAVCICNVITTIVWTASMENEKIPEGLELGIPVYNLSATQIPADPDSPGLLYGFYKEGSSSIEIEELGTYFRIESTTGRVFTYGNKLDFEASSSREFKINLIARTVDGSDFNKRTSTIVVGDVNDEKPKFENDSLSVSVLENYDPGVGFVALRDILITDVDTIITAPQRFLEVSIQYCIIGGEKKSCDTEYQLKRTSILSPKYFKGDFIINTTLNFEDFNKIQVQLVAKDGNPDNTVTTDVVVNVIDVQDLPPYWKDIPNSVFVNDSTGREELFIQVIAEDQDNEKRPISYSLLPSDVQNQLDDGFLPVSDVFEIDQFSGIIRNKIPLDLEDERYFRDFQRKFVQNEWPLFIMACEILSTDPTLVVGSDPSECANVGIVNVNIEDINDQRPVFDSDVYLYKIPENVPNDQVLFTPEIQVTDLDTEIYNIFFSYLDQPSLEFGIIGEYNRNPAIIVKNSSLIDFDYGPKEYSLTLYTEDVNNPAFFSKALIIIEVLDVNDNRPNFVAEYRVSIPEDSLETDFVVKVEATDIDSDEFGTEGIIYELSGTYADLFSINETGHLTVAYCATPGVNPCLDYDVQPTSYDLQVTAIDNYGRPVFQKTTITVIIDVFNVNDNGPTVGDYTRYIRETETSFTPELIVQGFDRDNATLFYSIESQFPGNFWAIDRFSGRIFVDKGGEGIKFGDGSLLGTFELRVIVTDNKYEAVSTVTIIVIDINDNAPQFIPQLYNITIDETTKGGTYLLTVTANDADDATSDNGRISYSIVSGNVGGRFNMINSTGEIYVSNGAKFDYETQNLYIMQVVARDQGQPQLTGNATVIVNIRDANNKAPSIDPSLQEFTLFDNVNIGYFVGVVNASDPDDDAQIRFEWGTTKEANSNEGYLVDPINGYDFRDLFVIDETNGRVYTNKQLDSKRANLVRYEIIVTDITPDPVQRGYGTVVFNIRPFNTKPPVFEPFDSPIYIDEERVIDSGLMTLIAQDDNGINLFELIEQPDTNFFALSPTTGSVVILNRIDYDDRRMINDSYFIAIVTDTGEPQLTATASVSVIFRNINDNLPQFVERDNIDRPKNIYSARIEENSPDGTPVVTVFAFDRDRPDNNSFHEVRYYMEDDRFDVDPMTGEIVVRLRNGAVLDRETNPRINTRVVARDNPYGFPQNQQAAAVIVTLTDVNDNPPQFSREEYHVQIFETIGNGTEILQLFSTDRDTGENARSYYRKIPGVGSDKKDFFDVRREAGRIYLKKSVLRNVGTYTFYVEAIDLLGRGFTTNATVIVDVLPSANSPPIWVIPPIDNMTIYVLEEQYNGMLVYDVSARDLDTGVNGVVDYSFIYDGETTQKTPEFKINKVTGVIQAEIVYDRELVDTYVLLLNASDRGETRLSTTRFLTVVVLDVNDNAPRFAETEIEIRIAENRPLGEIQKIPSATDPDLNPIIVYKIIAGDEDGTFELDPVTRMLYLRRPLDREVQSIYYLDVQASNDEPDYTVIRSRKRRATDSSIITVKVLIGDINDEAPRFLQDEYYGCVSARAPFEKHILTVQAIDSDAIGTGVVRYQVTNGHTVGNTTLFGIHEKFGIVTNRVLMRRYADSTFYVTINARDREDIDTAESANTVAKIFVNQPGNEVKLLITQNTGEVRLYQSQIQSILEQSTELDYVCINDVRDHVVDSAGSVSTLWSDVFVTGIRRSVVNGQERHTILSTTEFINIINTERHARKSDFDLLYIREVEAASSSQEVELEDQAVLIILIIVAILIFLVIIFCILAFMCIRAAKRHKKEQLLHKTHATPPPMVQEPVVVEPIIYDNRVFVQDEQPPVQIVEEQNIVEHDPVHVQYAVVQKRSPSPQIVEQVVRQVVEDDQDAIVVELKDDDPAPRTDVYTTEPEYRIETDLVDESERF